MESYMDETELEKSIKKLIMYKSNFDLFKEDIEHLFDSMNEQIKTDNQRKMNDLNEELTRKEFTASKLLNQDIEVLERNLDTYRIAVKEVSKIFKDI